MLICCLELRGCGFAAGCAGLYFIIVVLFTCSGGFVFIVYFDCSGLMY